MQPAIYKRTAGYKSLMINVIYQAVMDLTSTNEEVKSNAMEFLKSEDCETFCDAISLDYRLIEKIDYNNITEYLKQIQ